MTKPILLTPGPLTTSHETKSAMLIDHGSWDEDFRTLTARLRGRLLRAAGGSRAHAVVPLQGSGTYAVEAAIGTFVPRAAKILILQNGAYGKRMARVAETMGRRMMTVAVPETRPISPQQVASALAGDPDISHVGLVHCETGTGLLNPLDDIAAVVRDHGRRLIVDSISTFGALPLDIGRWPADAVVASANKGLESVPGFAFVFSTVEALTRAAGNSVSLSLDLADQWRYMDDTGQWRFTPPTHTVAALDRAFDQLDAEGGISVRHDRYRANMATLLAGIRALGLETLLPDHLQAPVILTVLAPADPAFAFPRIYEMMKTRGFILYPGKTTDAASFRIGCIGAITPAVMERAVAALGQSLEELGVRDRSPATPLEPVA